MKMVKSLLLGSAAGLLAVAAAQAADMPVKAAPVEYVKICNLYGAGFYYVPGTDTCVKIGSWIRAEYASGSASISNTPLFNSPGANSNTLLYGDNNDFNYRARATISFDARSQTEWGTVRAYMNIGWTAQNSVTLVDRTATTGVNLYTNRAFLQWAGFTFGRAQSFYDLIPQSSFMYWNPPSHDTGDQGTLLAAYTTQWGNGISSTISAEYPRRAGVLNVTAGVSGPTSGVWNNDYVKNRVPDVVANIRIDQAWGSFQVMGALHDASAAYWAGSKYNSANSIVYGTCDATSVALAGGTINSMDCGSVGDKWGWAAGVGAVWNMPFIAKGDRLAFQVNVAEGASVYVNNNGDPTWFGGSYDIGRSWLTDAVLANPNANGTGGTVELTKTFGFIAAYEHFWTPALRTSFYGGGYQVDYNDTASSYLCSTVKLSSVGVGLNGAGAAVNNALCDPDSAVWFAGTRTQWNIRPDFYMGVDLIYQKLETANKDAYAFLGDNGTDASKNATAAGARPAGWYKYADQDALAIRFRVQRNIVP